jgi:hypothetical protein
LQKARATPAALTSDRNFRTTSDADVMARRTSTSIDVERSEPIEMPGRFLRGLLAQRLRTPV